MKWRDFSSAGGGVQPMLRAARLLAAAVPALACSPVFNWREVPVGESLVAMLPCKPDRAERSLPMGAATVPIDMAGCEAGGATFAGYGGHQPADLLRVTHPGLLRGR